MRVKLEGLRFVNCTCYSHLSTCINDFGEFITIVFQRLDFPI